jgi:MYXO-CTERM domain-containing protein
MKRIVLSALIPCLALLAGADRLSAAVTTTTLHSFDQIDGWQPIGALVDGGDGYLYGTTQYGGSGVTNPAGTVFRVTPGGSLTSLYSFDFQVTGDEPFAGVLRLGDGTLFGTTRGSGSFNGSVFRLGSGGDFTSLHTFTGYFVGADGGHPQATLVEGGDGNLYGTTTDGGASNIGTLYRIDAGGSYAIVHSFRGGLAPEEDGATPLGALVLGDDGALYGTTSALGPTQPSQSSGTVFRYTPGVSGVATIHAFKGSDGSAPNSTLVKLDGYLYGTTSGGGAHNWGTVFRISESGAFESLHSFDYASGEGTSPVGLAAGSDGNLYGTTATGGASFLGTVYRLRPSGSFQTVFSFSSGNGAGYGPRAPLVQAGDGDFYGTTFSGGEGGYGTVFKIEGGDLIPEPGASSGGVAAALGLGLVAAVRRRRGILTTLPPGRAGPLRSP